MFESQLSGDFKKKRISQNSDLEPQEILLDRLAQKKIRELGVSEKKFEVPLSKRILQFTYFLFLVLIFILLNRTFQLQLMEGENFLVLAERNKFIIYQIKASRGIIYDGDLNQLVFNQPSFHLICNKNDLPEEIEEKTKVLEEVAGILQEDPEDLKEKIDRSSHSQVLISENLSHQTLITLETKIQDLPGFVIDRNYIREYEDGPYLSHLIGYTGKIQASELQDNPEFYSITDWVGRDGLEKYYEEVLRKNPGKLQEERDALGNLISKEIIELPEPGKSLVLWLDSDLQKKSVDELKKALKLRGVEKGAVIALDPKTGGVLSLVSLPGFDNNLFSEKSDPESLINLLTGKEGSLFNRAIAGTYPPGSIIKPLIATGILEEKLISPNKLIYAGGYIQIPHRYNPDIIYTFKDWKIHGWVDLRKAIAVSCNVYFFTMGGGYENQEGLGPSRIKEYLELFGWGDTLGIDLPGEATGLIPSPQWKEEAKGEKWWDGDTYNFSIGQGNILVTPLQVTTAFGAIANGGKLLQPQLVQRIVDSENNTVEEFQPEVIRENFIGSDNIQIVREGMRQVVTLPEGTGYVFSSLSVAVASKTGTAQAAKDGYYHKWVTVFAPYNDPEIVLTVMMEDVKGTETAVLPLAYTLLDWYFTQN
jgi:penicillin-binding protein 2